LFEQKAGEHDEHEGAADILQAENGQDCRRDDGSTFADRLVLVTTLAMKASQPKAPEDWRSSASPSCRHRSAAFTRVYAALLSLLSQLSLNSNSVGSFTLKRPEGRAPTNRQLLDAPLAQSHDATARFKT